MKGSETYLLPFLEGAQKYFIIPVYQRKYDWKIDNCRQLYEDLKRMLQENRPSHFFGSIVSAVEGDVYKRQVEHRYQPPDSFALRLPGRRSGPGTVCIPVYCLFLF